VNPPLVDIHSHLPAAAPGSLTLLCVDPAKASRPAPPGTSFCCGIHPWTASATDVPERFLAIRDLVDKKRLAAIGETGFDRIRREVPMEAQLASFRLHADLAERAVLPLVLHCVRANSDILAEHSRRRPKSAWIIHGCSASGEELAKLLSRGIVVSMGPRELFRPGARENLHRIPSELLFLETDDSGIDIGEVYRLAAETLDCPVESLARRIHDNWLRQFGNATETGI
jgi:TatD DNase family protein